MVREYIEERNGAYYISGSRATFGSVIWEFLEGASPESIADDFPTLSLEQAYGAVTFYLANRAEADAYLRRNLVLWWRSLKLAGSTTVMSAKQREALLRRNF